MDAMTMAKKQVYKDLIATMHKKMVAMGETPESPEETLAPEMDLEGEEAEESMPMPPLKKKSGMTITLAAIKKAPKLSGKPAGKMPFSLEQALMGKDSDSKFKKKA